ncbi:protein yippee-like 1 isoform X2 [Ictidomys tridecemlineatus]
MGAAGRGTDRGAACFFCQRVQQSRRSSSASPELSEEHPAEMVKMTKSKTFQAYLPNCHRTYSCIHCRAHLANHDELISKSFQGSQGRAYLFNSVVNVGCGPAEERVLLTGLHAVADIYCENCKTTLGWKYASRALTLKGLSWPSPWVRHPQFVSCLCTWLFLKVCNDLFLTSQVLEKELTN